MAASPPPCSEQELLLTSDFAIEGEVVGVTCGPPRDPGECTRLPNAQDGYQPLLVSDCMAVVRVTKSLQGEHRPGDEVEVPFLKLVQECRNGIPMIPGAPKKDFRLHSTVRYYNSVPCRYSSFFELEAPIIRGDSSGDGVIDIVDAVAILIGLFVDASLFPVSTRMDADADDTVTVADCVYLLGFLFQGGPPPPDPYLPHDTSLDISVICENEPAEEGFLGEWSLSMHLETAGQRLLIDAGANESTFTANVDLLGLDLGAVTAMVFTHIHDDHIGGRGAALSAVPAIPVYFPASFADSFADEVSAAGCAPIRVSEPVEIAPGLLSTGELAGDPPEHALFVRTAKGVVVITACAHPGIVEIVRMAKEEVDSEVRLVLGGFHLSKETEEEALAVIEEFRALGVRQVAPCHCTGEDAEALFRAEYGSDYIEIGAGTRLALPD
jgi:7,8-dihydropterin-6-yl-methyl-4-(beta-D-ribofuranosyl)aminobenzene 5'-phosphate synthase